MTVQGPGGPAIPGGDDRFRAVFEHAPIGMAIVALGSGLQGRCLNANSMLAAVLAMPVEQLTGIPLADFVHRDDQPAWEDALARLATETEDVVRVQLRLRARGGKDARAALSLTVAHDDANRWRCAIVQIVPL